MPIPDLVTALAQVSDVRVRTEEPLRRHLPLRVGGPVQVWAILQHTNALLGALRAARACKVTWRIHWPFSDWIVRDGGLTGVVFRLGLEFESITLEDGAVHLGSAALWSALPPSLEGRFWNDLRTWPGTVGGWLEHGIDIELPDCCTAITVAQGGKVRTLPVGPNTGWPALSKTAIPLGLTFCRNPPPKVGLLPPPPPGTLFKDLKDSTPGRELERAGVADIRLRKWRLAHDAPGCVVHLGGGSCKDVLMLANGLRHRVHKLRGANLEIRIPVLGNEPGRRRQ